MNMKKTAIVLILGLFVLSFAACSLTYDEDWKASKDVVSSDGFLQLTVPETYEEVGNINELANLQLRSDDKVKFTVTIFDPKSTFSDSFTLNDYYEGSSQSMASTFESAETSDAESITIGDYDALQFTVSGMSSNVRVKCLETVIETDLGYYLIVSSTAQYLYYDSEATFKKIADSFVELQSAA